MELPRRNESLNRLMGHFWTVAPYVAGSVRSPHCPPARRWTTTIENEFGTPVVHTGKFRSGERDTLVVVLHGMGGGVDRSYCVAAAGAAAEAQFPCLRLALRGADGEGRDFHHAGFVDDLKVIFERKPCSEYDRIALMGYSLGGHVALTAAGRAISDRLQCVVAICSPLDLKACQEAIDEPTAWPYRRHLLRGLKETYPTAASGFEGATPVERIEEVTTLREWDSLTVVPRFGFRDVDHYYESQSVGPKLSALEIPGLFVGSPGDPMVPGDSLRGWLADAGSRFEVRWVRDGGHVYFPPHVDLGIDAPEGVEHQVMGWIAEQGE